MVMLIIICIPVAPSGKKLKWLYGYCLSKPLTIPGVDEGKCIHLHFPHGESLAQQSYSLDDRQRDMSDY